MADRPIKTETTDPLIRVQEALWFDTLGGSSKRTPLDIVESATLRHDLGLDELDMVTLVMSVEEEFGIDFIPQEIEERWITVGDVVAYVRSMGA